MIHDVVSDNIKAEFPLPEHKRLSQLFEVSRKTVWDTYNFFLLCLFLGVEKKAFVLVYVKIKSSVSLSNEVTMWIYQLTSNFFTK